MYHFIIQICYRTHWLNVICIVQIFRSLHRLCSPGYSVPPLGKHFHILYNRFLFLFSQSMMFLSQTCLAKICILLCICIEVNVMNTPEGLFMLCVHDGGFPYFVFTFSYYGTVSFRSYQFPQIKLLINCPLPLLSTDYPWHYRLFGCIPVYRKKKCYYPMIKDSDIKIKSKLLPHSWKTGKKKLEVLETAVYYSKKKKKSLISVLSHFC